MAKLYSRINWVDYPSVTTPMNATNMNKMDKGLDDVDNKLESLTTTVANHATVYTDLAQDVTDLTTVVNTKANKTQSGWIEPAMINNWVNYGNGWETFGYMKDEFGFVHLKGVIKGGITGSSNFTLPVGFRPPLNKNFAMISSNEARKGSIMSDGLIFLGQMNSSYVCFDGVTFKV